MEQSTIHQQVDQAALEFLADRYDISKKEVINALRFSINVAIKGVIHLLDENRQEVCLLFRQYGNNRYDITCPLDATQLDIVNRAYTDELKQGYIEKASEHTPLSSEELEDLMARSLFASISGYGSEYVKGDLSEEHLSESLRVISSMIDKTEDFGGIKEEISNRVKSLFDAEKVLGNPYASSEQGKGSLRKNIRHSGLKMLLSSLFKR